MSQFFDSVQANSPPGTGGVAEGRGGRSSPKLIFCLNLSTSPARQARRPLLFQEGSRTGKGARRVIPLFRVTNGEVLFSYAEGNLYQ